MLAAEGDVTLLLRASNGKMLLLDTARIAVKTARDSIGVQVVTVKGKNVLAAVRRFEDGMLDNPHRYHSRSIPSAGYTPREEDVMAQISLEQE